MMRFFCVTISILLLCCLPLQAADKWLQNDGFESGGTAYYQMGFIANEIMASVFVPDPGDYPCKIKTVRTLVQDGGAGGTIGAFVLTIWADSGSLNPGAVLFNQSYQLTAASAFNDVDLTAENIIIESGGIRIGYEHVLDPPPSFCRDGDGTIQSQRNLIFGNIGMGWNWYWTEMLGLQGDWIHRVQIDTNYSSNTPTPGPPTATPTDTPVPPTNTPEPTATQVPPTDTPVQVAVYFDQYAYYGEDAYAVLAVQDTFRNQDPFVQETVTVRVWSQSTDPFPGGFDVTLYEDGPDSSTFQSIFPHVRFGQESRPADAILGIEDAEKAFVRYLDAAHGEEYFDEAYWYAKTISVEFILPDTQFSTGDMFQCDMIFDNAGSTVQADVYVLLDVYGMFFCYPGWQSLEEGLTWERSFIPGQEQGMFQIIPAFEMPPVGAMGPFYFYGCMFEAGELSIETLVSNIAVADFVFN